MSAHKHCDQQITGRTAGSSSRTLPGKSDLLARFNPCRDRDGYLLWLAIDSIAQIVFSSPCGSIKGDMNFGGSGRLPSVDVVERDFDFRAHLQKDPESRTRRRKCHPNQRHHRRYFRPSDTVHLPHWRLHVSRTSQNWSYF